LYLSSFQEFYSKEIDVKRLQSFLINLLINGLDIIVGIVGIIDEFKVNSKRSYTTKLRLRHGHKKICPHLRLRETHKKFE
jgi:hypothetical protein